MIAQPLRKSDILKFFIGLQLLSLCASALWGCAPQAVKPDMEGMEEKITAEKKISGPFKPLWESHIKKASDLEQKGNLSAAAEELKIALTIYPDDSDTKEKLRQIAEARDRAAEKRYKKGLSLKKSDPSAAASEFLAALRIKPDYHAAVDELRGHHLAYAQHKLQGRSGSHEVEAAGDDPLEIAITFYNDGDYKSAIEEFLKAKSQYPKNQDVIKYLNLSYYNSGINYYEKKEYKQALDMFLSVKSGFEKVNEYIKKTRSGLVKTAEDLYKMGLKFYREQQLNEAIAQWKNVLEIAPNHAKAKEYIERAKKLLESLKKHN